MIVSDLGVACLVLTRVFFLVAVASIGTVAAMAAEVDSPATAVNVKRKDLRRLNAIGHTLHT
ncbi:hypothetical protein ABO01nite_17320 [Asaia bogorensis NBRC 16594]|uniref:Uncharacterized protein n=1 Tax=Asaia bogorensis NBRC 16594 TaxID=1231624 RepID=A0AAN4U3K7_9PROT|nr:hypothetical protein ABO01nite_17320 [Asaia bogorensis NBRC 16594]